MKVYIDTTAETMNEIIGQDRGDIRDNTRQSYNKEPSNVSYWQLLKCEDLLLFFVLSDSWLKTDQVTEANLKHSSMTSKLL